jgi:hypothetical protein
MNRVVLTKQLVADVARGSARISTAARCAALRGSWRSFSERVEGTAPSGRHGNNTAAALELEERIEE